MLEGSQSGLGDERMADPTVRSVVEPLAATGALARAGIADLEEWDRLTTDLEVFDLVETSAAHVRRAGQVQRLLAANSQSGRKIPDLLIAAAAEAEGLVVLHYDQDFDRIAEVTGQPTQWVVPSGTID